MPPPTTKLLSKGPSINGLIKRYVSTREVTYCTVLYFLVLYCTLWYCTVHYSTIHSLKTLKHFKVSDFKSPLMDASGIKSARVAKGAKGARISRCWGLKVTRVTRVPRCQGLKVLGFKGVSV